MSQLTTALNNACTLKRYHEAGRFVEWVKQFWWLHDNMKLIRKVQLYNQLLTSHASTSLPNAIRLL